MWGDSCLGTRQLLADGRCRYLIYEAPAEITMAVLTKAREDDPEQGYARDVMTTSGMHVGAMGERGVRAVTNAGGINPKAGADVVITGRCVDSALVLGPLIHEFGWAVSDYDALSQGSLSGHLLECGPQSIGGPLTDWEATRSWARSGYSIAEVGADGSFVLTTSAQSDGLVDRRTVGEQLVYEIGDPAAYLLPGVICDWTDVQLEEIGPNRVRVSGARGFAPLRAHLIELVGAEDTHGPHARMRANLEIMVRLALHHDQADAPVPTLTDEDCDEVPLVEIAHGRSGDKGNDVNIGIIARNAEVAPDHPGPGHSGPRDTPSRAPRSATGRSLHDPRHPWHQSGAARRSRWRWHHVVENGPPGQGHRSAVARHACARAETTA